MSTTVDLQGLWIGYGTGFASQLHFNAGVSIRPRLVTFGRTDVTASGRIIGTSEPGLVHAYDIRIGLVGRTDREALVALAQQMICIRTGRGECLFGWYLALDYPSNIGLDTADISFVFNDLTYSIEV